MPVDQWHETISDPTLADAIFDRRIHNAYNINLKGEPMKKSGQAWPATRLLWHNADTSGAVPRPSVPRHRIRWPSSKGMHAPLPCNPHSGLNRVNGQAAPAVTRRQPGRLLANS
ncbi:hypothetical protein DFAR_430001 [Desulfarculales bacterium]